MDTYRLAALSLILLGQAPLPAVAADLGISPTRARLTAQHKVETLTLRNPGADAVDYQVTVRRWRMDGDGRWLLEDVPAGDALAVFPLAFRVAPGQAQVMRVGLLRAPVPGPEVAYRLLIRELPREQKPGESVALSVLNQISLPVFVGDEGTEGATVSAGSMDRNHWSLRVQAGPRSHLPPRKAKLRLVDGSGRALHEQDVSIGYVLAGASLKLDVALPPAVCRAAVSYELDAGGPLGRHLGQLPGTLPRPCGG